MWPNIGGIACVSVIIEQTAMSGVYRDDASIKYLGATGFMVFIYDARSVDGVCGILDFGLYFCETTRSLGVFVCWGL
jgi:hypothetical protein